MHTSLTIWRQLLSSIIFTGQQLVKAVGLGFVQVELNSVGQNFGARRRFPHHWRWNRFISKSKRLNDSTYFVGSFSQTRLANYARPLLNGNRTCPFGLFLYRVLSIWGLGTSWRHYSRPLCRKLVAAVTQVFVFFFFFWRWTNISCCLLVSLLFTAPGERWTKKSNRFVPFSFPLKGERWNECSRMRHPFFLVSHGISIAPRIGSFSLLFINVRLPFELIKFYSLSCNAL